MDEITKEQLQKLLESESLKDLTCVSLAKDLLNKNESINFVLECLAVDADKIRPTDRELYDILVSYSYKIMHHFIPSQIVKIIVDNPRSIG